MEFTEIGTVYEGYSERGVSQKIHPDDVMYNTGEKHYFTVGLSALRCILSGLSFTWRSDISRILDLPCGHGRVSRHIRSAFPKAQLFFCDIDRSGVDFCSGNFAGSGVYSKPDLTAVELPNGLDIIWIGSLFTHIDKRRTVSWLAFLADHLSQNGIIVATFHGLFTAKHWKPGGNPDMRKIRRGFEDCGYGYARYRSFNMGDYGFSLSKPSAVLDIATDIPDTRVLSYTERGWANNHDVLVLCRNDRLTPFGKP